jgi:uncharacterized membrane protein YhaH (DUF805 family)
MSASSRAAGFVALLTSFRGRIGRRSWWIGYLAVVIASLLGTAVLDPHFFTAEELPPPSCPDTIWQLALVVPGTAITVKRFNDRDWPWWLGYAVAVIVAFRFLAPHFGLPIDPHAAGLGRTAFWVSTVLLTAVFIDNGFFHGTDGPNRYGPHPLQRSPGTP